MVSRKIIKYLENFEYRAPINECLLKYVKDLDIHLKAAHLKNGASGFATLDTIYISMDNILSWENLIYLLLHEMAHVKRMRRMGKAEVVQLWADENFDSFINRIIKEEILADRYARTVFYFLTNQNLPTYLNQFLHLEEKQKNYRLLLKPMHGRVKNEEDYEKMLEEIL